MKVTLITGASSGIGEAFARRLAANEHDLVLVARSENKLHELCDELMLEYKIMAHYVALDLLEEDVNEKLVEEAAKHGFEVDWLINNAGFGSMGDFAALDLEKELDIIRLNVSTLVALTHSFLPQMRERRRGTIINVSSSAGFQPIPFMATYAATKAFVVLKPGSNASEADLKTFVKGRLAAYKYPRAIEFLADLPKTATGKIQRFKLREREAAGK